MHACMSSCVPADYGAIEQQQPSTCTPICTLGDAAVLQESLALRSRHCQSTKHASLCSLCVHESAWRAVQLAAEEMGCLEGLGNLHIPASDAFTPHQHEIFEEDLDTHLQFSSLLQVSRTSMWQHPPAHMLWACMLQSMCEHVGALSRHD